MSEPVPQNRKHLVYFADPMCSWCWGFAPTVAALTAHFGERLPIALIMGGLRAGNRKPMTDKDKGYIREHWEHVHKASGQPFDFTFFDRDGFVYDTEPACRAVVAMRRLDPDHMLDYFAALQRAFYADGRDVTRADTLADIAGETGVDRQAFVQALASPEARNETARDFLTTQELGVRGFPTLLAGDLASGYALVTSGYRPIDGLPTALEKWIAGAAPVS